MPLNTIITASDIINRVAAEVGIQPTTDPYASDDPKFIQLQYLLNTAGEELTWSHPWEFLIKEHQFTTSAGDPDANPPIPADTGVYDLPSDFLYLLNQTGWEHSSTVPIGGPLSPQDWTYLKGRNLAQNTLYASFRISDGKFNVYPHPPPSGLDLNYEYISKNWVVDSVNPLVRVDRVRFGSDKPLFDRTLISRYLKLKYLESAGFDTTKAQDDFNQSFSFQIGKDKAAQIVNIGTESRNYPYLSVANISDTGFGT